VLGITALGADLEKARAAAYAAVREIRFDGAQFRRDIGMKALARVSHQLLMSSDRSPSHFT